MNDLIESRYLFLLHLFLGFDLFGVFFTISVFQFMHVCFGHADHDEISEDVEEEYGHAEEEYR